MSNEDDVALARRGASTAKPFTAPKDADGLWMRFLRNKAEATSRSYAADLRAFAQWSECDSPSHAIERLLACEGHEANATVVDYIAALESWPRFAPGQDRETEEPALEGYAHSTINRRIYALRSVVDFANLCGMIDWKIGVKMEEAEPAEVTRGPGPQGYATLLAAVAASEADAAPSDVFLARRDAVVMRLLHDSCLRCSEATGIHWPDGVELAPERQEVLIRGKGRRAHQWVPLSSPGVEAIRRYLELRGHYPGFLLASSLALARKRPAGARMARSTVNRRLTYWSTVTGVLVKPHGLRHTAITSALDATNGDKRRVQKLSRHRSQQGLDPYDDRRRPDARILTELVSDPSKAEPHR